MRRGVDRFGLHSSVASWKTFCPLGFRDWRRLIEAKDVEVPRESAGVHLWHEMWRAAGVDRDAHHHPASLYERLRRRYLSDNDRITMESLRAALLNLPVQGE